MQNIGAKGLICLFCATHDFDLNFPEERGSIKLSEGFVICKYWRKFAEYRRFDTIDGRVGEKVRWKKVRWKGVPADQGDTRF